MDFFHMLERETEQSRQAFLNTPILTRGVRGDISLQEYILFLSQAYHHVKHTVPLLMTCGGRLPESHNWLRTAVAEYISEELGHEEWILNDIAACGADAEFVRHSRPFAATEFMIAYAYDTIQRINPVGFFGMVYVLEGTSIKLATHAARSIQDKLHLPDKAFSYLTSHGSLDISHMRFFQDLMNRIDDPADQQCIIHAANRVYALYGNIFQAVDDECRHHPTKETVTC
jgi:pyrroloquinoline quinone (PQQ) biosynthesis protein C